MPRLNSSKPIGACPQCGRSFPKQRPHQIYCTTTCRMSAFNSRRNQEIVNLREELERLKAISTSPTNESERQP